MKKEPVAILALVGSALGALIDTYYPGLWAFIAPVAAALIARQKVSPVK